MKSIERRGALAGFSLAAVAALGATSSCAREAAPAPEPTVSASAKQPGEMTLREEIATAYKGCKIVGVSGIGKPTEGGRVSYSIALNAQLDKDVLNNPGPDFYRDSPKVRPVNLSYAPPQATWKDSRIVDSDYARQIPDSENAKQKIVDTSVSLLGLSNLSNMHGRQEIVEVSLPVHGYEDKDGETSTVTAERVCGHLAISGDLKGVEGITILDTPARPEDAPVRMSEQPFGS